MLLQQYELNVVPNQRIGTVTVNASQYDKDSRTIRMAMYNGEVPFQIPSGSNVYVIGTKADSTGYQYECTYVANQNIVTFDIQPQMTVLPGFHTAEIRVTKDGEILGSANFKFQIERGALSDDTVISDTDLPLVEKAAEAVDALEDVTDAIEAATAVLENIDPIATAVQNNALKSEGFAVGEQNGTPVESGTYYHNNSKYYSEQASSSATNAHTSEVNASGYESNALSYKNSASQSASDALGYKNNASASATTASNEALKSEGYAVGKQNGTDVSSGTYYHNNAKYFSEQASTSATNAHTSEVNAGLSQSNASGSATNASNSALVSEGWAKGSQNGTDVTSGSPYYENNAKYYAEQAEASAQSLTVDPALSTSSTNPVQNKVITTELNRKANYDGLYEDMTVGQLTTNITVDDKDPYVFRTAGGSAEIGNRESDKLVGCSYAWNQLVENGNFASDTKWTVVGATKTISNNTCTIVSTGTGSPYLAQSKNLYKDHTYLFLVDSKMSDQNASARKVMFVLGWSADMYKTSGAIQPGAEERVGLILKPSANATSFYIYLDSVSADQTATFKNVQIFDLTLLFGSTIADYIYTLETSNAGDGVAFFKKYFPKGYYPYCAESLLSVNASSHNMTGFNQWDEEWELGVLDSTTGNLGSDNTHIASSNYIHVLPSTSYCLQGARALMCQYDADKNYIGIVGGTGYEGTDGGKKVFTTADNCHYLRFNCTTAYGTTYKNDICINLHWDGERDGEYEPYDLHSYPLDSSLTLRGIPKLDASNNLYCDGDTYESDGTVTRKYGILDLGSLTWNTGETQGQFFAEKSDFDGATDTEGKHLMCSAYRGGDAYSAVLDNVISVRVGTYKRIWVFDTSKSSMTEAQFKTAMNGQYLVYELATPTTESADPFQDPQVVDNWGTEEYVVTAQNGVEIPVGHDTIYPIDLKAKLEVAPDSPDLDGDYLMHRENGENSYVVYIKELPTLPSENGTYVLKCTVSGGTKTLSWESAS